MKFMLYYKTPKMSGWNAYQPFEADSAEEAHRYAMKCQQSDELNRLFKVEEQT